MTDTPVPSSVWQSLSEDDRVEYFRLRTSFQQNPKVSSKDRRVIAFPREIHAVLRYLERSPENMEARCIITGLCFVGPVVCINTRQLKRLLNRCKSSINGSFQQLGYVAFRTKSKARSCAVAALPALERDQNLLRQWTCRVASQAAQVCFVSTFRDVTFPDINETDLLDEKRPRRIGPITLQQSGPEKQMGFQARLLEHDLPDIGDLDLGTVSHGVGGLPFSFSMDFYKDTEGGRIDFGFDDLDPMTHENSMAKSKSADLAFAGDWDPFVDGLQDSFR
jgi:hypothetical protein